MHRLRAHLYFGPSVHPEDLPRLQRQRISAVLSLQEPGIDLLAAAVERMRVACEPAIRFVNVAMHDHDPGSVIERVPVALAHLHDLVADGRTVYVHCSEGVNRAPSVVLAHLVRDEGLAVDTALAELRRCDRGARPYERLIEWLREGDK